MKFPAEYAEEAAEKRLLRAREIKRAVERSRNEAVIYTV